MVVKFLWTSVNIYIHRHILCEFGWHLMLSDCEHLWTTIHRHMLCEFGCHSLLSGCELVWTSVYFCEIVWRYVKFKPHASQHDGEHLWTIIHRHNIWKKRVTLTLFWFWTSMNFLWFLFWEVHIISVELFADLYLQIKFRKQNPQIIFRQKYP